MKGISSLDEASLKDFFIVIRDNLVQADVPFVIIEKIVEDLRKRVIGVKVPRDIKPGEYLAKEFYAVILHLLQNNSREGQRKEVLKNFISEAKKAKKPFLLFLVGLQGAGKTTTVGKLLHTMIQIGSKQGIKEKDLAVISLDFDRPAAKEQLKIVAESIKVDSIVLDASDGIHAAEELHNKINSGQLEKKIIIVDTAGRLVIDQNMMTELTRMYHILKPQEVFLVIDSMMSQEGVSIAESFTKTISCSGCIVTKVDSDAPGGIILGICYLLSLPILYVTVGEKLADMRSFDPSSAARRLLGMGEILELAREADKKLAAVEEEAIKASIKKGDISIDDFVKILSMINQMGPMKQILSMLPRDLIGGAEIDSKKISEMDYFNKSIVIMSQSMTKKERLCPLLLQNCPSRMKRISRGAGIELAHAENFIKMFFSIRSNFNMFKKFI